MTAATDRGELADCLFAERCFDPVEAWAARGGVEHGADAVEAGIRAVAQQRLVPEAHAIVDVDDRLEGEIQPFKRQIPPPRRMGRAKGGLVRPLVRQRLESHPFILQGPPGAGMGDIVRRFHFRHCWVEHSQSIGFLPLLRRRGKPAGLLPADMNRAVTGR